MKSSCACTSVNAQSMMLAVMSIIFATLIYDDYTTKISEPDYSSSSLLQCDTLFPLQWKQVSCYNEQFDHFYSIYALIPIQNI